MNLWKKLGRLFAKWHARTHGYFWLPCPICGAMFGGHEAAEPALMDTVFNGRCVCRKCADEANRRNAERFGLQFG